MRRGVQPCRGWSSVPFVCSCLVRCCSPYADSSTAARALARARLEKRRLFEECCHVLKHILETSALECFLHSHLRGPANDPFPEELTREQFVTRLSRWSWLITAFETIGGLTHIGFSSDALESAL